MRTTRNTTKRSDHTVTQTRKVPGFHPLCAQIKELFVQRLASGLWRPGELLPSEFKLAREYQVSQGTVRKALNEMAAQHLLVRKQGKGTFVATHNVERALFHFFLLVGDNGAKEYPDSTLLSCREAPASGRERDRLDLPPRASVVRIARVRSLGGRPCIVERIAVPATLFPGLAQRGQNELPNTLYQYYEQNYGITITQAVERVRAVAASAGEARHLGLKPGAPLLEIDRVVTNLNKRPIEWRLSRCDTRRHHYLVTLK